MLINYPKITAVPCEKTPGAKAHIAKLLMQKGLEYRNYSSLVPEARKSLYNNEIFSKNQKKKFLFGEPDEETRSSRISSILESNFSLAKKLLMLIEEGCLRQVVVSGSPPSDLECDMIAEKYKAHPISRHFEVHGLSSVAYQFANIFAYNIDGSGPGERVLYGSKDGTLNNFLAESANNGAIRNSAFSISADNLYEGEGINVSSQSTVAGFRKIMENSEGILLAKMPLKRREVGSGRAGLDWRVSIIGDRNVARYFARELSSPQRVYAFMLDIIPGMRELEGPTFRQGAWHGYDDSRPKMCDFYLITHEGGKLSIQKQEGE